MCVLHLLYYHHLYIVELQHESSNELDHSFTDGGSDVLSKNKIDKQFQQAISQYSKVFEYFGQLSWVWPSNNHAHFIACSMHQGHYRVTG